MRRAHPLLQLHDVDLLLESFERRENLARWKKLGLPCETTEPVVRTRKRLAARVDARWRMPYERALKRYGRGLAAVRDRVCLGCFITLPTSASPNSGDTLTVCESCGRLLYWP